MITIMSLKVDIDTDEVRTIPAVFSPFWRGFKGKDGIGYMEFSDKPFPDSIEKPDYPPKWVDRWERWVFCD